MPTNSRKKKGWTFFICIGIGIFLFLTIKDYVWPTLFE